MEGVRLTSLIVAAALTAGCGGADTDLVAGRQALERRDLSAALARFRAASARLASNPRAHVARGETAELLGEFDEALGAFQTAVRLEPSAANRFQLGTLAERLGEARLAVDSLTASVAGLRLTREVVADGLADAVTWLEALAARGNVRLVLRLFPATLSGYHFDRASAAEHLFRVLLESGDRAGAVALARSRGWVRPGADYCRESDGRTAQETQALLALALDPERADCLLAFGEALADGGLVRLSRLVLTTVVDRARSPQLRERAEWFQRIRLPGHGVPARAEALVIAGYNLQYVFGKPDEALRLYQQALAVDPDFSWALRNVGRVYDEQKNPEAALEWFRKALAVDPDYWKAHLSAAGAAWELERWGDAEASYRQAVALNPGEATSHADLGRLLLKLGREAEGIHELQTAVRLDPTLREERTFLNRRLGRDPRVGPTPFSAQ